MCMRFTVPGLLTNRIWFTEGLEKSAGKFRRGNFYSRVARRGCAGGQALAPPGLSLVAHLPPPSPAALLVKPSAKSAGDRRTTQDVG